MPRHISTTATRYVETNCSEARVNHGININISSTVRESLIMKMWGVSKLFSFLWTKNSQGETSDIGRTHFSVRVLGLTRSILRSYASTITNDARSLVVDTWSDIHLDYEQSLFPLRHRSLTYNLWSKVVVGVKVLFIAGTAKSHIWSLTRTISCQRAKK